MIKFKFFSYPVEIDFTFLILLAFIGQGFLQTQQYYAFLEISLILFVSIFVHELGHALMFSFYKVKSKIDLYGMGGYCTPDRGIPPKSNIFVSLAGPFAGFILAGIYWLAEKYVGIPASALTSQYRADMVYLINIVYGLLNLLPVYPMDGGHALKGLLQHFKIPGADKISFTLSIITLIGLGFVCVHYKQYFALIVVAWLASDNFNLWQQSRKQKA
jgi:Zn-dependent protease